jgi:hypothetical protein
MATLCIFEDLVDFVVIWYKYFPPFLVRCTKKNLATLGRDCGLPPQEDADDNEGDGADGARGRHDDAGATVIVALELLLLLYFVTLPSGSDF